MHNYDFPPSKNISNAAYHKGLLSSSAICRMSVLGAFLLIRPFKVVAIVVHGLCLGNAHLVGFGRREGGDKWFYLMIGKACVSGQMHSMVDDPAVQAQKEDLEGSERRISISRIKSEFCTSRRIRWQHEPYAGEFPNHVKRYEKFGDN